MGTNNLIAKIAKLVRDGVLTREEALLLVESFAGVSDTKVDSAGDPTSEETATSSAAVDDFDIDLPAKRRKRVRASSVMAAKQKTPLPVSPTQRRPQTLIVDRSEFASASMNVNTPEPGASSEGKYMTPLNRKPYRTGPQVDFGGLAQNTAAFGAAFTVGLLTYPTLGPGGTVLGIGTFHLLRRRS